LLVVTSHLTQNRSSWRCSPSQSLSLIWKNGDLAEYGSKRGTLLSSCELLKMSNSQLLILTEYLVWNHIRQDHRETTHHILTNQKKCTTTQTKHKKLKPGF